LKLVGDTELKKLKNILALDLKLAINKILEVCNAKSKNQQVSKSTSGLSRAIPFQ